MPGEGNSKLIASTYVFYKIDCNSKPEGVHVWGKKFHTKYVRILSVLLWHHLNRIQIYYYCTHNIFIDHGRSKLGALGSPGADTCPCLARRGLCISAHHSQPPSPAQPTSTLTAHNNAPVQTKIGTFSLLLRHPGGHARRSALLT